MAISAWASAAATAFFAAACLLAAARDVASYTIPNRIVGTLLAAYLPFSLAAGVDVATAGMSVAGAACVFVAGAAVFAKGILGGGDVKFASVAALWVGPSMLPWFLLLASVSGAVFALAVVALRSFPLPAGTPVWLRKRIAETDERGIPYGVALAFGALAVLPHAHWATG